MKKYQPRITRANLRTVCASRRKSVATRITVTMVVFGMTSLRSKKKKKRNKEFLTNPDAAFSALRDYIEFIHHSGGSAMTPAAQFSDPFTASIYMGAYHLARTKVIISPIHEIFASAYHQL